MRYRVEQLTIHLQPANEREERRAWEHEQGFSSPERYVLLHKNVILMQKSRRKMDFESNFSSLDYFAVPNGVN